MNILFKPDYLLLQVPGLGGDNHSQPGHKKTNAYKVKGFKLYEETERGGYNCNNFYVYETDLI